MDHQQTLQLRIMELVLLEVGLNLPATSPESRVRLAEEIRNGLEELKPLWRGHSTGATFESREEFCRWILGYYALLVCELEPEFIQYVENEIYGVGDRLPDDFPPDASTWLELELRRLRQADQLCEVRTMNLIRGLARNNCRAAEGVARAVNAIKIAEE